MALLNKTITLADTAWVDFLATNAGYLSKKIIIQNKSIIIFYNISPC